MFLFLAAAILPVSCGGSGTNPPDSNSDNIIWQQVPWTNGEVTKYRVANRTDNTTLGYAEFTILKEGNAWVFRQNYNLTYNLTVNETVNETNVIQQITVKVRGQDLKPISGNITGSELENKVYTEYTSGNLLANRTTPAGQQQNQTFDISGIQDGYDHDEAIFLVRSLPLQIGYLFSYTDINPQLMLQMQTGQLTPMELKVTNIESLSTTEGPVWAYNVSLMDMSTPAEYRLGTELLYGVDAPHYLLRVDDGRKILWLIEHS